MFEITRFSIYSAANSESIITAGSFNTTMTSTGGKVLIRNNTYVSITFSVNNFASMMATVSPGQTTVFVVQGYSRIYWKINITEPNNTPPTRFTIANSIVIVEGYALDEEIPSVSPLTSKLTQQQLPLLAVNDLAINTNSYTTTAAGTTTLPSVGTETVSVGCWMTLVRITMGIPTANVNVDFTLTDAAGRTIDLWHINTGTVDGVRDLTVYNPPLPGALAGDQGGFTLSSTLIAGGPSVKIVMQGIFI